jgi:hypothetical protein
MPALLAELVARPNHSLAHSHGLIDMMKVSRQNATSLARRYQGIPTSADVTLRRRTVSHLHLLGLQIFPVVRHTPLSVYLSHQPRLPFDEDCKVSLQRHRMAR